MSATYHLSARADNPIPHDVLVEHIAVALQDFKFAGKVNVKMVNSVEEEITPFSSGKVVFDDAPQSEPYTGPQPPRTFASGGWVYPPRPQIDDRVHVTAEARPIDDYFDVHVCDSECRGEVQVVDPYPLTTRVMDALRGRRRG